MKSITLERYKRAGRSQVAVGRFTFHVQRPTPYEMLRAREDGGFGLDFVAAHVVGWEGVKESDLIPSGDPEPLEFDAALFAAWMEDEPDLWGPISEALKKSYADYEEAREARGKL